jgi:hypothetical protein
MANAIASQAITLTRFRAEAAHVAPHRSPARRGIVIAAYRDGNDVLSIGFMRVRYGEAGRASSMKLR